MTLFAQCEAGFKSPSEQLITCPSMRIVTTDTTLGGDILVIEVGRQPAITAVTIIALCCGGQVVQVLTHGGNAVVAAVTGPEHLEVIHQDDWIPQVGGMTVLADVGRIDVIQTFTSGRHTIVAGTATFRGDVLMVKVGGQPTGGTMTVITLCRG